MITYCLTILLLFWYLKEKQIFTLPLNLSYDKVWPLKPWSLWRKFWNINWRNTLNPNSDKHEKSARSASAVAPLQRAHKWKSDDGATTFLSPPIFSAPKACGKKSFIQKNIALGQNLDVFNYLKNLISEICVLSQRWYVFVQKGYLQRNDNDIFARDAIWNWCHEKVRKYRMEGLSKAKNQH